MCVVQQTGCTGGNNGIGTGTDTDFVGACTPALTLNGTPDMHVWTMRKQQTSTLKDLHLLHLSGGAQVQTPTQSVFPQTRWL
jgi:hypothetical protein